MEGMRRMMKGSIEINEKDSETVGISKKTTNIENWPSGISGIEDKGGNGGNMGGRGRV